ncbi:MAG: type IV toxin-antitoxin system AbiEi family antitoxin domain-containing protein [Proteobacteria bacterium]|nr:type IV toxin-antitoxin system AbiEi family antitoxin domain-containing protein [Pseudomonadota bacterium]MBU2226292.1 type IV toxin-antitoxin system AbiEi family antitoxin domain-containing protein [Pseudomonadota bacterium]MBU2261510.1 type IV toxin-antitoxin system AbiEi family antitoxin domain-containing protein [Pseudomonadota bacterium]
MKYNDLVSAIKSPIFSLNDLALSGLDVFDYQLSLWVKKGHLIRLKNGLYAFSRDKEKLQGEGIAFLLYQPSYLSLETALAWYGFIPEIVYAYTSITAKTTRTFENACGRFIYRHVKSELFWGYVQMNTDHGPYLLAEPEKALLDYFYLNLSRIDNEEDFENIRLNEEEMEKTLDKGKLIKYLDAFGVKKMERWAKRCLP